MKRAGAMGPGGGGGEENFPRWVFPSFAFKISVYPLYLFFAHFPLPSLPLSIVFSFFSLCPLPLETHSNLTSSFRLIY